MATIQTYNITYDIDAILASQGSSVEQLLMLVGGLKNFFTLANSLTGDLKDYLMLKAFQADDPLVKGVKELQDYINKFLLIVDADPELAKEQLSVDDSAEIIVKRQSNLIVGGNTYTGDLVVGKVYRVTRGGEEKIRLDLNGKAYFWDQPIESFTQEVSCIPNNLNSGWVENV